MNIKIKDTTFPSPIRLIQPKSINLVILHRSKNRIMSKENKTKKIQNLIHNNNQY